MINNEENVASFFFFAAGESRDAENWNPGQMFQMEQALSTLLKSLELLSFTPAETSACGILGRSSGRTLNIINIF